MGYTHTHTHTQMHNSSHRLVLHIQCPTHPVKVSENNFHSFQRWYGPSSVVQTGNAKWRPPKGRTMWLRQVDITRFLLKAKTGHGISAPLQDKEKKMAWQTCIQWIIDLFTYIFSFSGLNAKWFMKEAKSLWRWHTHSVERKKVHILF